MLKRMVIGLPRSGTTWAANWLTYGGEVCVHDPLYHTHYRGWKWAYDAVSCTGIYQWPEFVAAQTCPVLVLHRPIGEIKASLLEFDTRAGGWWLDWDAPDKLRALDAPNIRHMKWDAMFDVCAASEMWRFLHMPSQFDARRHEQLVRMRMEPRDKSPYDADEVLHARLMAELRERKAHANAEGGAS
jgi:hypothetical protein